jgi:peptidoglycan/LPS O-acetylase OafA/YrhL
LYLTPKALRLGDWGSLAAALACVLALAELSMRFVEAPALRLKDRFRAAAVADHADHADRAGRSDRSVMKASPA